VPQLLGDRVEDLPRAALEGGEVHRSAEGALTHAVSHHRNRQPTEDLERQIP
jgi:hypothetical protein